MDYPRNPIHCPHRSPRHHLLLLERPHRNSLRHRRRRWHRLDQLGRKSSRPSRPRTFPLDEKPPRNEHRPPHPRRHPSLRRNPRPHHHPPQTNLRTRSQEQNLVGLTIPGQPIESSIARYGRPSLVVLVLFQTEKNVNKHCTPNYPARRPRRCRPYLIFQLLNNIPTFTFFFLNPRVRAPTRVGA